MDVSDFIFKFGVCKLRNSLGYVGMLQGVWLLRPKGGSKEEEQPSKPNSGQSVTWKPQNTSRMLAIHCAQSAVSVVAWLMSGNSTDVVKH
jgi:hypothetical protein